MLICIEGMYTAGFVASLQQTVNHVQNGKIPALSEGEYRNHGVLSVYKIQSRHIPFSSYSEKNPGRQENLQGSNEM